VSGCWIFWLGRRGYCPTRWWRRTRRGSWLTAVGQQQVRTDPVIAESVAGHPTFSTHCYTRWPQFLGVWAGYLPLVQSLAVVCYYSRVLSDTSPEAMRAQTEAQRRLGGAERFRTTCMMSQTLRELGLARIHSMHPELDARGILDQLLAELYDFRRIT